MGNEELVYETLNALGLEYQVYHHEAVFTVEEANEHCKGIPGTGCKNLFLKDSKGKRHFLVVVPDEKKVDIKKLGKKIGIGSLGFASPERLMKYMNLTPGSVSPFGLINDKEGAVEVLVDKALLGEEKVTFHPNINTATVVISTVDFKKFLESLKNKIEFSIIPEME